MRSFNTNGSGDSKRWRFICPNSKLPWLAVKDQATPPNTSLVRGHDTSRATGVAPHEWCICSSRLLMNKYRQTLHARSCWEFNFALKLLQESMSICHFGDFWSELVLIYTGWMVGTCPVCLKTKDQESWTLKMNIVDCDHAHPIGAYWNTKWILGETKCTSLLDHTHSSLNNIVLRLLLIVQKLIQIPSAYSKWSSYLFKSLSCPWLYQLPQLPQAWPSNLSGEHQLAGLPFPFIVKICKDHIIVKPCKKWTDVYLNPIIFIHMFGSKLFLTLALGLLYVPPSNFNNFNITKTRLLAIILSI